MKSLSLTHRLVLGFATLLLLMSAVAGYGIHAMGAQAALVRGVVEVNNGKAELAHAMLESIDGLAIHARSAAILTDAAEVAAEVRQFGLDRQRYLESLQALKDLLGPAAAASDAELVREIEEVGARTLPLLERATREGESGSSIEATATLGNEVRPGETAWRSHLLKLIQHQARLNDEAVAEVAAARRTAMMAVGGLLLTASMAGAAVAWNVIRGITIPIRRIVGMAERIASGDLSAETDRRANHELGRLELAIMAMQQRLRELVMQIRTTADSIALASAEVATGNLDLSQRTELSAGNLQQAAAALEQLTDAATQSSEAAQQAGRLAAVANDAASRGGGVVAEVMHMMSAINDSARRIADIIGVIDSIAFQTNILALNAAVEAARAAEHGRGFAVVAAEVRSLARHSANAAGEIKALITNSVERIDAGSQMVDRAGAAMRDIDGGVRSVTAMMLELSMAARAQHGELLRVNRSVAELDHFTQQNSALVEQSAAAADSLSDQARHLAALVTAFKCQPASSA